MRLAYRVVGSGPPLLILHGLFGQSDNWNTLSKKFADIGFSAYTIDLRNHGLSPHSSDWNYTVMATDVHEFMHEHALQNPILLGHSMGGKVSMFYDILFPGNLKKIIIADIAAKQYPPQHNDVLKALLSVDFDVIKTRKEAEDALSKHIFDIGTRQFLLKNIYWKDSLNNKMDWRFDLKTISENYPNVSVEVPLFESSTPCMVIKGSKSNYILDTDIIDFKNRYSQLEIKVIENAGHWVHAEQPNAFFEVTKNFIVT
ncbi:MAG: alpha/beta fold hydrolase [Bacteroidetes bacterium]|nr:alpha/beta fold hydrolase [Bacteroidota bacterium]